MAYPTTLDDFTNPISSNPKQMELSLAIKILMTPFLPYNKPNWN